MKWTWVKGKGYRLEIPPRFVLYTFLCVAYLVHGPSALPDLSSIPRMAQAALPSIFIPDLSKP